MIEIGREEIITEVSMMASHMGMPRDINLEAVLNVFSFLRQNYNSRMAFDPTYPVINMDEFKEWKWKDFYGYLNEDIPPNTPEERGEEIDLYGYIDSEHAGEKKTRRSCSIFFILLNSALIQWFSKNQATIETSVFGAEFVAMKIVMATLQGIRYKTSMTGAPISGPSYIYGDNMSVIHNTSEEPVGNTRTGKQHKSKTLRTKWK